MQNQWADFDDFELIQVCFDYGIEEECKIEGILPVTLSNRKEIETLLTEFELDMAFAEATE